MKTISIKECVGFAWTTFKKRPWFFIGIEALLLLISYAFQFGASTIANDQQHLTLNIFAFLLNAVVGALLAMGKVQVGLQAHDNVTQVSLRDFLPKRLFLSFVGVQLLLGIGIVCGFFLFIVPGIFLSIVWMFASYIVIDQHQSPIQALKTSFALTRGNRWNLLLLSLALMALNVVGIIALLVGLLVTIPMSLLTTVHAYRLLQAQNPTPLINPVSV